MFTAANFKQQLQRTVVSSKGKWVRVISLTRLKSSVAVEQHDYAKKPVTGVRDIPGPSVFENISLFFRTGFRQHHVYMEEMFERFGPIFRQTVPFEQHTIYFSDPVDIEHVYRSQEGNNPFRGDILVALYGKARGLERGINGDDQSYSVYRKLIAPKLLQLGALKPFFTEVLNVADDTVANFKEGKNLDLQEHLRNWAAEAGGVILFGLRFGTNYSSTDERVQTFIDAVNGYFHAEAKLLFSFPLYKHFETPTLASAYRHLDTQMAITREWANEAREQDSDIARNSMFMRLESTNEISEDNVLFLCHNMLIAAIHTTAGSTLHLLHALSKHPEVQRKAYDEIRNVLGDNQQTPTYEHLSQLKYLRAMIKEGFRFNAAPPGNIRVTKSPVDVRGYHIPPETTVIFSSIASREMQRQKYGNPEEFSPERWLRSSEQEMHPFSSLPFSFGKRSCPGRRVVDMELTLLMLRLLQKYEIVERKDDVNWIFRVMITPDRPYDFYLKKRQ